jgi:hypothetical protein
MRKENVVLVARKKRPPGQRRTSLVESVSKITGKIGTQCRAEYRAEYDRILSGTCGSCSTARGRKSRSKSWRRCLAPRTLAAAAAAAAAARLVEKCYALAQVGPLPALALRTLNLESQRMLKWAAANAAAGLAAPLHELHFELRFTFCCSSYTRLQLNGGCFLRLRLRIGLRMRVLVPIPTIVCCLQHSTTTKQRIGMS